MYIDHNNKEIVYVNTFHKLQSPYTNISCPVLALCMISNDRALVAQEVFVSLLRSRIMNF